MDKCYNLYLLSYFVIIIYVIKMNRMQLMDITFPTVRVKGNYYIKKNQVLSVIIRYNSLKYR